MKTPRLEIYPDRIKYNAESVIKLCKSKNVSVACVTKVTSAHIDVADAMIRAGADMLADSRVENLFNLRKAGLKIPLLLLRLPTPSEAYDVVRTADISLNSSLVTLKALSSAATLQRLKHKVIIMVDVGDLREGVWPDHLIEILKDAKDLPGIEIIGLGCNLACYGGVIPSVQNMTRLVELRNMCRAETGLALETLSGGNSSGLPLLASGNMPREINHFRIGEAIILGRNVIDRSPWQGTRQDTCIGVAEAIEVEKKTSIPIGERGQDAFGETQEFIDRGIRKRAICNIGRQDVVVDGITPYDPGIIVLGGSSDHLILDVEKSEKPLQVGDEISFFPGYGALLALSTSSYVHKYVIRG
ncbi:MAG: alanine/ornithine racemase family PLP-dependent enzyme [Candidatus Riflebacteria bacterium]|nr:alanine/ornithine racemase family PLP-dependent enzyme [Candidatus Riflebacteria bacterium]